VTIAVEFNGEAAIVAIEIDDKWADGMLPTKLQST